MDAATQPNAKASRRKWVIISLVVFAFALTVYFLGGFGQKSAAVTGVHLGGNAFFMTNHSDETLYVNVLEEVQTNGQWITRPVGYSQLQLAAHESKTNFLTSASGPAVPIQPWRLHGSASTKLEGFTANLWAVRIYLDMLCHGRKPRFNPLTSNPTVFANAGEFIVYPVSESTHR